MLKRVIKVATTAAVIACLVVGMVPSVAFADVVEFTEAAKLGASIVDIYGAANNTSLALDALSDQSAFTVIETLYQDYSSQSSDPYTLAAIGAAAAVAGSIAVVYDAITGQGQIQLYQEQYVSSLDGFWDYTLTDAGFTRNVAGFFEWSYDANDEFIPVFIAYAPGDFSNQPLPIIDSTLTWAQTWDLAFTTMVVDRGNDVFTEYRGGVASSTPNNAVYSICYKDGNSYYLRPVSLSSFRYYNMRRQTGQSQYSNGENSTGLSGTNYQTTQAYSMDGLSDRSLNVPVFPSLNDALAALEGYIDGSARQAVFCEPSFFVGDPLIAEPTITVPNTADPNYAPQPKRINTGVPYDPLWGDPLPEGVTPEPGVPYPITDPDILNNLAPDLWTAVVQGIKPGPGTDPDPDPDPDPDDPDPDPDDPDANPGEFFIPVLPVTLPSFNFSLSGIWHYVREWVSSLGAWFTTLFLIWSKLPYAMVVPVYATAVVVIVLGVYKRFFM